MPQTGNPDWMTFDVRITEVAGILAAGIIRKRKREMTALKKDRKFCPQTLDVSSDVSVHCTHRPLEACPEAVRGGES